MDAERFDRLARGVTHTRSRRGLLGVLGSGALAIGVSVGRPQPAEALPARRKLHEGSLLRVQGQRQPQLLPRQKRRHGPLCLRPR